ncbi:hypothetical protein [Streptomyces xantholiticus]|uniref:hypothetical protein n=1 Tax=Streptomyces xantholiticus TaxID=68285 RepID=UPI001E5F616E|nr:hypothetical protein [Streptomyces xantholiticus]
MELGVDVRCLLDSAVPGDVMRTAWLAASCGRFDPAAHGMDMSDWLQRLADLYPGRPRKRSADLRDAIVQEVRTVAATLSGPVATALESIISECDEDLGLRLFLRVVKNHGLPVGKDQYDRLMALGTTLRYPGPLVYEGINVQWPPIDTTRRDATGDFGFSGLTSWFAGNWHDHTARETVQMAAANDDTAETPGSAAAMLLEDTLRLLESPLSAETISTLWLAASERGFSIDRFSIDARHWLGQIVDVCTERLRTVDPAYRHVTPPIRSDLTDVVLREVREARPLLEDRTVSPHWQGIAGPTAAQAIEEVIGQVDPDLGFRLFLRLLTVLSVPLTAEQYSRYHALGEQFGYGEFHVGELEVLVRHD